MQKIALKLLQLQAQMRMLHWQTTSYAEHMAFGGFYTTMDPLTDQLIEALQGKYGRVSLGGISSLQVSDYGNLKINMFLMDIETFLTSEIFTCGVDQTRDTEILNILDEMKAEINKLKYLLTLK